MGIVRRKEGIAIVFFYFEALRTFINKNNVTDVARNELYQGFMLLLTVVRSKKLRKGYESWGSSCKHLYGEVKRHNNEKLSGVSRGQRDIKFHAGGEK